MAQEYQCKLKLARHSRIVGLPAPDPFVDGDYLYREVVHISMGFLIVALLHPSFTCFTMPEDWDSKGVWMSKKSLPPITTNKWQAWWTKVHNASRLDEGFSPAQWLDQGCPMNFRTRT